MHLQCPGEQVDDSRSVQVALHRRFTVRPGMGNQCISLPRGLETDAESARSGDQLGIDQWPGNCGRFARLLQRSPGSRLSPNDLCNSARGAVNIAPCEQCGSPARIGDGRCLSCVLREGFQGDNKNPGTLDEVLEEVHVHCAEWRIGDYQILEEIGRGGTGVIYCARERNSQRIVALKRILSVHAESRETIARFRSEAVTVARLRHPNIVPIYGLGETEDGLPFFTMKYAARGSLLQAAPALRQNPRRIVSLIAKVSRAVQHAHLHGVLHRDLKPGNILLDESGEPLVSDFGLARSLDASSDLTRTLTSFGTPGFISPEQARGPAKNLTPAADIYSIGAVLFYLLAGRPPFIGENALAVVKQATDKAAPKLRTFAPDLDRELDIICAKCLERDPKARYFSAANLAEDLECWLEGRAIIARRVPANLRIWRWSRHNPIFAGTLAASVGLLVLNVVAAFTISHLLSIIDQIRPGQHTIASMRFEKMRELTPGLDSITEAKNLFPATSGKPNPGQRSTEGPAFDALPGGRTTDH